MSTEIRTLQARCSKLEEAVKKIHQHLDCCTSEQRNDEDEPDVDLKAIFEEDLEVIGYVIANREEPLFEYEPKRIITPYGRLPVTLVEHAKEAVRKSYLLGQNSGIRIAEERAQEEIERLQADVQHWRTSAKCLKGEMEDNAAYFRGEIERLQTKIQDDQVASNTEAPVIKNPFSDDPRGDWVQDFDHENGQYTCRCLDCDNRFMGHKRRIICRMCSNEPRPVTDEAVQLLGEVLHSGTGPCGSPVPELGDE
jgi:uncharacterized small protein (DUF1192 family)